MQWVVWLVFTCGMAGIYRPLLECKIRMWCALQIVNYTLTACVLLKCTLSIHGAKPSGTKPYQITIAAHLCICALKWVHLSEVHCNALKWVHCIAVNWVDCNDCVHLSGVHCIAVKWGAL